MTDTAKKSRTKTQRRGPLDPRLLRSSSAARRALWLSAVITFFHTLSLIGFAASLSYALVWAIDGRGLVDIMPALGAALGFGLLRGGLLAISEYVLASGAARASIQLRDQLMTAVTRLGPGWLSTRNGNALAVTAGHGLEALDGFFGRYLPQLIATVIATPLIIVGITLIDPLSGLIIVLTLPLIPIFMVLIGLATGAVQRQQYDALTALAARFADTVKGLGTLKIFGRHHRAADSISDITQDYKNKTMKVLRVTFMSSFALEFLASISVAVIAVTIGFRLLGGQMTLLPGLFVLLLAPEAYLPLRQVGMHFHAASEGMAASDDIFAVIEQAHQAPSPRKDTPNLPRENPETPVLAAQNLMVIDRKMPIGPVNLTLLPGEIVLLDGPSGAGKSRVLSALLGFAEYTGTVTVSAQAVHNAREMISWMPQRAQLMSGSVAENITLGAPHIDQRVLDECLTDAALEMLPITTELGAGGTGLSGGQAQRVSFARALYRLRTVAGVRLLALDEPSSALDRATEEHLWQSIRQQADTGTSVLLISHRPPARTLADQIVPVVGGV